MNNRRRGRCGLVPVFGILLASLLWLPVFHLAYADFSIGDWSYYKPVTFPPLTEDEQLVEVTLDRDVFGGSAPEQVDLRLVEIGGREVAYQLVVERGGKRRQSVEGTVRDLGHVPGQYSSFVVDLGREGLLHNKVEILTDSKNFKRVVAVEGSSDARSWSVLRDGVEIFDFTVRERDFNARNTEVDYPDSTARYLRVRVINNDEAPLRISGANISLVEERPADIVAYDAEITSIAENAEDNVTVVEVDLGSANVPTNRLTLHTSSVNFYREVSVEGSADGLPPFPRHSREGGNPGRGRAWVPVSSGFEIYAYDTAKFAGRQLDLSYSETTYRYMRLTIHNEDNPPLSIDGVEAQGLVRRVLFLAQPGETYSLYYGNPNAGPVSYDLATLLPYLDTDSPIPGNLGAQMDNPGFAVPQPPFSERFPWLVPVGVAAAAAVMALLLFGFFKQARKSLPPQGARDGSG